jgi:hypothetical protein
MYTTFQRIIPYCFKFIHMHSWMQAHMQAQTHMYSRIQNLVEVTNVCKISHKGTKYTIQRQMYFIYVYL